ncbi:hypothetical protein BJV82DRAFT_629040 [Fennellomyces sp. T-0311]|nr:hypothetical protein BJV82DRAFT_629040 [Fennellomyces sp. T-0311]
MSQKEDPAEAATLPYDPEEELTVPKESALEDNERAEGRDHDDAPLPVNPPIQETPQPSYRSTLRHNPALLHLDRNSPLVDPGSVARQFMDQHVAHEELSISNHSAETQRSTLTDTQFNSPPTRLQVRDYEGSDSSQVLNDLRRYTNPLNDLGSQDSFKSQFFTDNYDRQHRMDIKGPRRSNSDIVDDGPEFKRQKHIGIFQQNSDLTDYLGGHFQAKSFFTDKQKALINPRFRMEKYPDRDRAKTFAGKLSATARVLSNVPSGPGPCPTRIQEGIMNNLPPVTVEQLKYQYNLSLSSEDASPESQRHNPYISPQRDYNPAHDTSPLRYPEPTEPTHPSSTSSLGTSLREASTQSISSHEKLSNMSDRVERYQRTSHRVYYHPEERFGTYPTSEPENDFSQLGDYNVLDFSDDSDRELTPEIEESSIPREDDGPSQPSTSSEPAVSAESEPAVSAESEPSVAPKEPKDAPVSQLRTVEEPKTSKKGKKREETPVRRSSRIRKHTDSENVREAGIKVMLSSAIEKSKRFRYKKFLDNKGAEAQDWDECTLYVNATIKKDTPGSICALILGKEVVDSSWVEESIKEQRFADYRCRTLSREKISKQLLKGKQLYFTKDCGFTPVEKKLISEALGATSYAREPEELHEDLITVVKDSSDPLNEELIELGYTPTLLDDFIKQFSD